MKQAEFVYVVDLICISLECTAFSGVADFTQKLLDHYFSIKDMSIFKVRDESYSNAEMDRRIPTPKCNVTITPVNFSHSPPPAGPPTVEISRVPDPVPPFPPTTIRERIRDRFSSARPNIEDFLINRRRFQ